MSSARKIIGDLFGSLTKLLHSAQNFTEAMVFAKLSCNELDEELFPYIAYFAMGAAISNTVATWLKNPANDAYEKAANTWQTAKGISTAGMIDIAVLYKDSLVPAGNVFAWAVVMSLMQMAADHGHKISKMSKEEFIDSMTKMNINKLKLTDMIIGYVKSIGLLGFLTFTPKTGQALEDAKNQAITPVEKGFAYTIAGACAEQALSLLAQAAADTYDIHKKYREEKAKLALDNSYIRLEEGFSSQSSNRHRHFSSGADTDEKTQATEPTTQHYKRPDSPSSML
jgi:hypothetical protein